MRVGDRVVINGQESSRPPAKALAGMCGMIIEVLPKIRSTRYLVMLNTKDQAKVLKLLGYANTPDYQDIFATKAYQWSVPGFSQCEEVTRIFEEQEIDVLPEYPVSPVVGE